MNGSSTGPCGTGTNGSNIAPIITAEAEACFGTGNRSQCGKISEPQNVCHSCLFTDVGADAGAGSWGAVLRSSGGKLVINEAGCLSSLAKSSGQPNGDLVAIANACIGVLEVEEQCRLDPNGGCGCADAGAAAACEAQLASAPSSGGAQLNKCVTYNNETTEKARFIAVANVLCGNGQ